MTRAEKVRVIQSLASQLELVAYELEHGPRPDLWAHILNRLDEEHDKFTRMLHTFASEDL